MTLVLASTSPTRRHLLDAVGLDFEVAAPAVDEAVERDRFFAGGGLMSELAAHLAGLKALDVSRQSPAALVIGADQTLLCDGRLFSKPGDRGGVTQTLHQLNGRTHILSSAVALARDGRLAWSGSSEAQLTMRFLSAEAIERYAEIAGSGVYGCVGGYQIESMGLTLFERIEGDHTTILGLPMLPLLAALRRLGVVAL
jgi:septum formation protein